MRILVVEDEASLREGISDLLSGDGHTITAVGDGILGAEAVVRDVFDLVVLDLMRPRLDGMDAPPAGSSRSRRIPSRPGSAIRPSCATTRSG